jgi:hypothetical protein
MHILFDVRIDIRRRFARGLHENQHATPLVGIKRLSTSLGSSPLQVPLQFLGENLAPVLVRLGRDLRLKRFRTSLKTRIETGSLVPAHRDHAPRQKPKPTVRHGEIPSLRQRGRPLSGKLLAGQIPKPKGEPVWKREHHGKQGCFGHASSSMGLGPCSRAGDSCGGSYIRHMFILQPPI